jgi:hypothetical protein
VFDAGGTFPHATVGMEEDKDKYNEDFFHCQSYFLNNKQQEIEMKVQSSLK